MSVKADRILGRVGFLVIVAAAIIAFYYFYLLFFPHPVTTFSKTTNLPVTAKSLQAGAIQGVKLHYCKHKPEDSDITIGLSDGALVQAFPTITQLPLGCHDTVLRVGINRMVPPDRYRLLIEVHYNNSLSLTPEVHELSSDWFQVTP